MNAVAALIQHDLTKEVIDEINEIRHIRLGLAEKQLKNITETAQSIAKFLDPTYQSSDLFIHQLKTELNKKITLIRERLENKQVIFQDEIEFYLSISRNEKTQF